MFCSRWKPDTVVMMWISSIIQPVEKEVGRVFERWWMVGCGCDVQLWAADVCI